MADDICLDRAEKPRRAVILRRLRGRESHRFMHVPQLAAAVELFDRFYSRCRRQTASVEVTEVGNPAPLAGCLLLTGPHR